VLGPREPTGGPTTLTTELDRLRANLAVAGHRLYVGAAGGGLAFADPEQAVLVMGPPRSGKTTALVIPNVLAAPGSVVVTSTKQDVIRATARARGEIGRCWLFDPTGSVSRPPAVTPLRWSPVCAAATWEDALVTARVMCRAARPAGRLGEAGHWYERAEALLAPLLHAAALLGGDMGLVVRWVLRQELEPACSTLADVAASFAADVLTGIARTDAREQSGIWSTAAGLTAAYRSNAVIESSRAPNLAPATLVHGADTVYIAAPARQQELVAPIVVAFVEQVRAGAYAAAAEGQPGPPVTLALDELANIAPLPDLPAMVSEGGGQRVLTLASIS
jgi:type IV secretory pathway TraG/TraD family ATPase VirD4